MLPVPPGDQMPDLVGDIVAKAIRGDLPQSCARDARDFD
jgi:hypothetical protein